jgi:hypothetical protein
MSYIDLSLCTIATFLTIGTAVIICCRNYNNTNTTNNTTNPPHYCATIVDAPTKYDTPPKYEDIGTKSTPHI